MSCTFSSSLRSLRAPGLRFWKALSVGAKSVKPCEFDFSWLSIWANQCGVLPTLFEDCGQVHRPGWGRGRGLGLGFMSQDCGKGEENESESSGGHAGFECVWN
ncbi:hypothetical protein CR513_17084, partial [Mucuna pruriens]